VAAGANPGKGTGALSSHGERGGQNDAQNTFKRENETASEAGTRDGLPGEFPTVVWADSGPGDPR
jgi:hypothetical protein